MIAISKEESLAVRERFPKTNIVRTMRQKSKRHHYYMEEMRGPVQLVMELRGQAAEGRSGRAAI